ncbi:pyrimidine 5'-nucleotidase [Methyloligella sp. 2.7D]|uniref:pyrimidine 5'-nucleotidase n=1 Tax=unclassified Methyloligella TaxID=2625955 RepID=UPI00157CB81C|nr:pyrimidine 5'-nucleotidase [Methyloligella sp. GL2]QKP78552.1 pyrimidine 5'-nucleotidase [Methyloligella sp. GL2]
MAGPAAGSGFETTKAWVFDLDNTLYPADCNLFSQIDTRMGAFISEHLGLSHEEAHTLRKHYYYTYGTTLAGLMKLHDVPPQLFLDYVHDIDLSAVPRAPELAAAVKALPGEKYVFTNGSREHAERVLTRLGLTDLFDDMFDIRSADYIPKPQPETYDRFLRAHGVAPERAAMFDDLPHNLKPAHQLGMTTVLVACGATDHPEHQAIAGWDALPPFIHHWTDALDQFLSEISPAALAAGSLTVTEDTKL